MPLNKNQTKPNPINYNSWHVIKLNHTKPICLYGHCFRPTWPFPIVKLFSIRVKMNVLKFYSLTLIVLFVHRWFQAFLSNTYNSIYIQLNSFKYCYQTQVVFSHQSLVFRASPGVHAGGCDYVNRLVTWGLFPTWLGWIHILVPETPHK